MKFICRHIFVAHNQWATVNRLKTNLEVGDVIMIEDYQQNMEAEYFWENPTTMAYSTNKVNVAVYPMAVYSKCPNSQQLLKHAIVFVSDDKGHDNQQVKLFEGEAVKILRDKGVLVKNVVRFSDSCASQYRSRYTNSDLRSLNDFLDVEHITWNYYEAHEGKNLSDTIGSIVKGAYKRAMVSNDVGVQCANDIVSLMRSHIGESTKAFSFFDILEVKPFIRAPKTKGEPLVQISKMRSIWVNGEGVLKGLEISCGNCTVSVRCMECK